jgi:YVTN family beta-propeller protein
MLFASLVMPQPSALAEGQPANAPRLRYPAALVLADNGKLVLAANERSGTVSIVDLAARKVVAECPVGKRLSDLVLVPTPENSGADLLLCTDSGANELKLLVRRGSDVTVADSLPVGSDPVSVRVDKEGKHASVASRWARRLTVVELIGGKGNIRLKAGAAIELPFAPRLQALSSGGKTLVVGGAFGGELAVVDAPSAKLVAVKAIPGHNIRGLAWSKDDRQLFVAHQTVNRLANTSPEDLHWGSVINNVLRSIERDALERPKVDVLDGSQAVQLGDVGNGAGDPAGLVVMPDGSLAVALAGVGEVAKGRWELGTFQRVSVGTRPTALLAEADGNLIVADTFGDSIAVVHARAFDSATGAKEVVHVSLGPQRPLSAAERGERLFFDARLGLEKWMSCHSCHSDGHSSDALSDTLGDGSYGAAKRIPPLGGVGETAPWAWNGSMHTLPDQVRKSFQTTLRTHSFTEPQVSDLAAYLMTLKPAPPLIASADATQRAAIDRGRAVFERHNCKRCHAPPTFTTPSVYDVGLHDEMGNRRFNPPSLRGVSQRVAFFHDGRAKSLKDVFAVHGHPGNTQLPQAELADLLAFLSSI